MSHILQNKLSKLSIILLSLTFIESAAGGLSYYLALYLDKETTLTTSQIGGIGSILTLANRHIYQKLIPVCLLLCGVSFLLLPLSVNFKIVCVTVFSLGLSTTAFLTANNAYLLSSARQNEKYLKHLQNIKIWMENAGNSVSMLLIIFTGVSLLVTGLVSTFIIQSSTNEQKYIENHEESCSNVANKLNYWTALLSVFFVGLLFSEQRFIYPIFLNRTIHSTFWIGALLWLDPLVVILLQVKANKLLDRVDNLIMMASGSIILGLSLFMLQFTTGILIIAMLCFTWVLGEILFMPASTILCFNHSKEGAIGAWRIAYSLGLIVGPYLETSYVEQYGFNSNWTLALVIGLLICSLCLVSWYSQKLRNSNAPLEECRL